ncbi:FAD-dependent oxidoreductase [Desulfogranum mediterraneum]|uniref:FAD-dependent oxidoreductase n=1 Tax=Desulfogranum mediterraneum TaxID=160661 RepID=UPI0003FE8244|nr:FAD-dependent oxidoreductase [Desulfogranum mediterraneum]
MKNRYDAIIIGAGPAGLACSTELADKGLEVAVLDEQAAPGGQIYRNISKTSARQRAILGPDYTAGLELIRAFTEATVDYLPQTRVWQAEAAGEVFFSHDNRSGRFQAPFLALNTGAMERPVPFPGWTLPGVMTCGGMSNLYKDSTLVPREPVVLAGSGPLLWLVAEHLLALEAPIAAILDTTPLKQMLTAMPELPAALRRAGYLFKGVKMIAAVQLAARKAKVPMYRQVSGLRAEGDGRVERVKASCRGRELSFEASTLLVHEGIIPNTALLRQVGCRHSWNPVQRYWHPQVDASGKTSLGSVYVAGDGTFVHGAKAAELKGRLTGLTIARELRRLTEPDYRRQAAEVQAELQEELLPRPYIDALYAPRKDLFTISDETTVCRCEGVTAGRIRELVEQGYTDHNEIKSIIRCGMGPCQGRMCGSAVMELVAEGSGRSPEETRQMRLRPPIKPVSLQELANATLGEPDES